MYNSLEKIFKNFDRIVGREWPSFWNYGITDVSDPLFDGEIKSTENGYALELEMPGVKKEDVKLNIEKEVLNVSWKDRKGADKKLSFTVRSVNPESINAKLEDGMLILNLEKKEDAKPRQIEVK